MTGTRMMQGWSFKNFIHTFLRYLYDERCSFCQKRSEFAICKKCLLDYIQYSTKPVRYIAGYPLYSPCEYTEKIRYAIQSLKFKHKKDIGQSLAYMTYQYITSLNQAIFQDNTILVPIPLYPEREKERGYNQSALIGKYLSKFLNISYADNLLLRIKNTSYQYQQKTLQHKRENMHNAFILQAPPTDMNAHIILLDDICTTGITLTESIKACNHSGITKITLVTVAHVPLR